MDIPPIYAEMMRIQDIESKGTWRLGKNNGWAMAVPNIFCADPSGWRISISVRPPAQEAAWDALRSLLSCYHLPARVATYETANVLDHPLAPGAGSVITLIADQRSGGGIDDVQWWKEILEKVEGVLRDGRYPPGRTVFSDRPLRGSRYLSLRCDRGPLGFRDLPIDYNLFSRPGPFWNIFFEGEGAPVSSISALEAILGPVGSSWEMQEDGAWITASASDLVACKRSFQDAGLGCRLELIDGSPFFRVDRQTLPHLAHRWHFLREGVDAWRVAQAIGIQGSVVRGRCSDEQPPAVVLPPLSMEAQASLIGKVGSAGLEIWRVRFGPLEIPVPGRLAADSFLANISSGEDADRTEVLPPEMIDPPEHKHRRFDGQDVIRSRKRLEEIAMAAAVASRRSPKSSQAAKLSQAAEKLRKMGIVGVEARQGLDRLLKPKEREVNAVVVEDPRVLVRDIASLLEEASSAHLPGLSSTMRASTRGAALSLDRLRNRPDLTMQRAFQAIQKTETIVGQTAYALGESQDDREVQLCRRFEEVHWRIQSRLSSGPPKVKLALTAEDATKMRKEVDYS